jgi:D-alanine transfer protein
MLKKTSIAISVILLMFFSLSGITSLLHNYYSKNLSHRYHPKLGLEATIEKSRSLTLNKNSIEKGYLPIFGSCELTDNAPNMVFKNGKCGFYINKIGYGGNQSIIQFLHLASLGESLKNKKIVLLISPFWFNKRGIVPIYFKLSFSELQFYTYMKNQKMSALSKKRFCQRILTVPKDSFNQLHITLYSYLYLKKDNAFYSIFSKFLQPLYNLKYKILLTRDLIDSYKKIESLKQSSPLNRKAECETIDWNDFKEFCTSLDKRKSNSELYCSKRYFKWRIEKKTIKKWPINMTADSPEYNDLALLLDLCVELQVKPLLISMPVHGPIYDHVAKWYKIDSISQRQKYYERIDKLVQSRGLTLLDLRHHEYTPWFSKSHSQIAKTGWAFINEEIYKFYHQK